MTYSTDTIIQDVRDTLGENIQDLELIAYRDRETLSLNKRIEGMIEEGATVIAVSAPLAKLGAVAVSITKKTMGDQIGGEGDTETVTDKESGYIVLPEDFLRLYVFKMEGWARSIGGDEARGSAYWGRGAAWRHGGSAEKPRVAIVEHKNGLVLEWLGRSESRRIEEGSYIRLPKIEDGGIEIDPRVYRDVIEWIARRLTAGAETQSKK